MNAMGIVLTHGFNMSNHKAFMAYVSLFTGR